MARSDGLTTFIFFLAALFVLGPIEAGAVGLACNQVWTWYFSETYPHIKVGLELWIGLYFLCAFLRTPWKPSEDEFLPSKELYKLFFVVLSIGVVTLVAGITHAMFW